MISAPKLRSANEGSDESSSTSRRLLLNVSVSSRGLPPAPMNNLISFDTAQDSDPDVPVTFRQRQILDRVVFQVQLYDAVQTLHPLDARLDILIGDQRRGKVG